MPDLLLTASRVVTPERTFAPGWVHVVDGRVDGVGPGAPPRNADLDLPDGTVVPGFVDTHVHGGGGASFDGGDPGEAERVVLAHRSRGTTTMLASLVTDSLDRLVASTTRLADLVDEGLLAGIHLEGPWLSPLHAGAHDPDALSHPDTEAVDRLVEAGRGHLRMVTLAPELPGALDAVGHAGGSGPAWWWRSGTRTATCGHRRGPRHDCRRVGTARTSSTPCARSHHREPGPGRHALLGARRTPSSG